MDDGTESGVASFFIPKTVQNEIRGCFISHPQKFSYIRWSHILKTLNNYVFMVHIY
jgi:hypothetical protein